MPPLLVPASLFAEPPSSPVAPELLVPELDGDPELEVPELDGDPELEVPELVPELVPPKFERPGLDPLELFVPASVPGPVVEPVGFSPPAHAPRIATHDASTDREAQEPVRTTIISRTSI